MVMLHTNSVGYLKIKCFRFYISGRLSKIIWILRNNGGAFLPVFQSFDGIGGYNLDNGYDQAIAFYYEHSGKSDYIVCYL
jgi:hypothetical protein